MGNPCYVPRVSPSDLVLDLDCILEKIDRRPKPSQPASLPAFAAGSCHLEEDNAVPGVAPTRVPCGQPGPISKARHSAGGDQSEAAPHSAFLSAGQVGPLRSRGTAVDLCVGPDRRPDIVICGKRGAGCLLSTCYSGDLLAVRGLRIGLSSYSHAWWIPVSHAVRTDHVKSLEKSLTCPACVVMLKIMCRRNFFAYVAVSILPGFRIWRLEWKRRRTMQSNSVHVCQVFKKQDCPSLQAWLPYC